MALELLCFLGLLTSEEGLRMRASSASLGVHCNDLRTTLVFSKAVALWAFDE